MTLRTRTRKLEKARALVTPPACRHCGWIDPVTREGPVGRVFEGVDPEGGKSLWMCMGCSHWYKSWLDVLPDGTLYARGAVGGRPWVGMPGDPPLR